MQDWIAEAAEAIAARAPEELVRLVAISSPSGDVDGAEEALAIAAALAPKGAAIERAPCSSADHADDRIMRVAGTGSGRVVLVGHVDTVVAHDEHRPLKRDGARLLGSGSVDMKGGVVLSLGVLRALAARTETFAEVALLLVCDEEWRAGDFVHTERFAGFDACLCFEGGELTAEGDEAVVVKRKAAGTLQVLAHGKSAHSGA
ncbi:MAG: M20/M25/M40 family metallo-hydrolase, partial [Solirubrobacteraceae bacterium]